MVSDRVEYASRCARKELSQGTMRVEKMSSWRKVDEVGGGLMKLYEAVGVVENFKLRLFIFSRRLQ